MTYDIAAVDRPLSAIRIHAAAGDTSRGWLSAGGRTIPVALGRGGIKAHKREGDAPTAIRGHLLFYRFAPFGPKMPGAKTPQAGITTGRYDWTTPAAATGSGATTSSTISLSRSITTTCRVSRAAAARYSCIWRAAISGRRPAAYR